MIDLSLVSFIVDKNPLYLFLNSKSVHRSSVDRFHGFVTNFIDRPKRGQNARKGERWDTVVARVTARWELNTFRWWWLAIGRSKESEWGLRAEKREESLERERQKWGKRVVSFSGWSCRSKKRDQTLWSPRLLDIQPLLSRAYPLLLITLGQSTWNKAYG